MASALPMPPMHGMGKGAPCDARFPVTQRLMSADKFK